MYCYAHVCADFFLTLSLMKLGFWASVTQYLRVLSVCVASARVYNDVMVASYDMYLQTFGIDNCNQAVSVLYQLPL